MVAGYWVQHIIFALWALVLFILQCYQLFLDAKHKLVLADLPRRFHFLNPCAQLLILIRSVDPWGWNGIYSPTLLEFLADNCTVLLLAMGSFTLYALIRSGYKIIPRSPPALVKFWCIFFPSCACVLANGLVIAELIGSQYIYLWEGIWLWSVTLIFTLFIILVNVFLHNLRDAIFVFSTKLHDIDSKILFSLHNISLLRWVSVGVLFVLIPFLGFFGYECIFNQKYIEELRAHHKAYRFTFNSLFLLSQLILLTFLTWFSWVSPSSEAKENRQLLLISEVVDTSELEFIDGEYEEIDAVE